MRPPTAAKKIAQELVKHYCVDPREIMILTDKPDALGRTLRSHGWYGNPGRGEAQVICEGADEWVYEITEKLSFEGVFMEPATGFALSLYKEVTG